MSQLHLSIFVPMLIVAGGLTGCHHAPYGPGYYNNYNAYPAGPTMVPQGQYINPGPTYVPQNFGPSPTPIPSNNFGSPTPINPSQPTPTWRPDGNNGLDDAPPYKPNPGATNPVPQPFELEPDFGSPPPAAALPRAMPLAQNQPFAATGVSTAAVVQPTRIEADPFEVPKTVTKLPTEVDPFDATPAVTASSGERQSSYGFDSKGYSWLRGIVDYDAESQTWGIIYNVAPAANDKLVAALSLAPHPQLKELRPGTIVLAKGRIDPGRKDSAGKALYEAFAVCHSPATGGDSVTLGQ